jgi:hypothetical protein
VFGRICYEGDVVGSHLPAAPFAAGQQVGINSLCAEASPALFATSTEHGATTSSSFTSTESVSAGPLDSTGLECTFHVGINR